MRMLFLLNACYGYEVSREWMIRRWEAYVLGVRKKAFLPLPGNQVEGSAYSLWR